MARINPSRPFLAEIAETTLRCRCGDNATWYLADQFPGIADAIAADVQRIVPYRCFGEDRDAIINAMNAKISGFGLVAAAHRNYLLTDQTNQ